MYHLCLIFCPHCFRLGCFTNEKKCCMQTSTELLISKARMGNRSHQWEICPFRIKVSVLWLQQVIKMMAQMIRQQHQENQHQQHQHQLQQKEQPQPQLLGHQTRGAGRTIIVTPRWLLYANLQMQSSYVTYRAIPCPLRTPFHCTYLLQGLSSLNVS